MEITENYKIIFVSLTKFKAANKQEIIKEETKYVIDIQSFLCLSFNLNIEPVCFVHNIF